MKKLLPILISCLCVVLSCNKPEYRKLDFNVYVLDAVTGDTVHARVDLRYKKYRPDGPESVEDLGETTYGKLVVDRKLEQKSHAPQLEIYGYGPYGLPFPNNLPSQTYPIELSRHHQVHIVRLDPMYQGFLHLRNVNCFNATDSVWVSGVENFQTYCQTGCTDSSYANNWGWTYFSRNKQLTCNVKVKRNGVATEFQHTVELPYGAVGEVLIEY